MVAPLTDAEIDRFVTAGFVKLTDAFSSSQARLATDVLLSAAGLVKADDRTAAPAPVLRVDGSTHPSVVETINTPRLTGAIDQLVGVGRWLPRSIGFGTFPIRFPSHDDPGDAGWHIDGSFGEPPLYRVNLASRGRALLLLMLFTDAGRDDAPTRIRVGSHLHVARALAEIDDDITFIPQHHAPSTLDLPVEDATGSAGTVYLCHPFLVHAASWPHTGTGPRVLAQPAIHHPEGDGLGGFDYDSAADEPVVRAVRTALGS